jgi:uncharacterized membrane protein YccC
MNKEKLNRIWKQQRPHLLFALRGVLTALAALALAELLGLECPYWGAMTALIVIQPTRGLLFEKSFYRLIGSAIGAGAGLLLQMHTSSPLLLTAGLIVWIAACVGIGNLLYGLRAYACMMAGCTCAIVAMIGYQNPAQLAAVAFGRVACVMVGIVVATAFTALFTPENSGDEQEARLTEVADKALAWLARLLREGTQQSVEESEREILTELADIEGSLELAGAGSLRLKRRKRGMQSVIAAILALLAVGRLAALKVKAEGESEADARLARERIIRHLEKLAQRRAGSRKAASMAALAAELKTHDPLLGNTLSELTETLKIAVAEPGSKTETSHQPFPVVRHREWREARRAVLRVAVAFGLAGAAWSITGWHYAPMLLMALSIMISIFSNKEHPARFVGKIFAGASTGTLLALSCRLLLFPLATGPAAICAIIAPFLCVGVFAMSHRKTAIPATDATLFFLLVTQPGMPSTMGSEELVIGSVAMVLGVGAAWISYRYLVPITPAIRLSSLSHAITRDLKSLAAAPSSAAAARVRGRMQHRVLLLVAMGTGQHPGSSGIVDGGLAALALGRCLERLLQVRELGGIAPRPAAIIDAALAEVARRPEQAARLLEQAAKQLNAVMDCGSGEEAPPGNDVTHPTRHAAALCSGSAAWWASWKRQCHSLAS